MRLGYYSVSDFTARQYRIFKCSNSYEIEFIVYVFIGIFVVYTLYTYRDQENKIPTELTVYLVYTNFTNKIL